MSTLGWILFTTVAGGVGSIVVAAAFSLATPARYVGSLISFAIGALLGAVFLEILPHAFEEAHDFRVLTATILAGILAFFVLEKLVLWRHCHTEDCEAHGDHAHGAPPAHDHGRSGLLILVGDSFHNFVDGVLIAAAFMESTALGIVTATAVIAHEIPQEVGDFLILLHSGYGKARAFALNLLSSMAMVAGALLAYFALQHAQEWVNVLLALAAASMIYVAVADLIPGLHKRPELRATLEQVLLIGLGVGSIWLVGRLAHSH
ncbi:MAG: ZIP family metal transporter [Burkholderiales bacterium]|jgi:zinc and cadmium transporter|nr:ZIP family metal transporter [Burkholderiales bacterium]